MKMHNNVKTVFWVLVCPLILMIATESMTLAQSSLNYMLVNSVADQGGEHLHSGSYAVVDAVGQPSPLGVSGSTNYIIRSGFLSGRIADESTSNESDLPDLHKEFQLFQNYPNPFTRMTTIRYALPEAGPVKLDIYNVLGEHIASLFNGYRSPGIYDVNYNGTALSPGVYLYKIQTGKYQSVKMMNRVE